jgi:hypothetical protein
VPWDLAYEYLSHVSRFAPASGPEIAVGTTIIPVEIRWSYMDFVVIQNYYFLNTDKIAFLAAERAF